MRCAAYRNGTVEICSFTRGETRTLHANLAHRTAREAMPVLALAPAARQAVPRRARAPKLSCVHVHRGKGAQRDAQMQMRACGCELDPHGTENEPSTKQECAT